MRRPDAAALALVALALCVALIPIEIAALRWALDRDIDCASTRAVWWLPGTVGGVIAVAWLGSVQLQLTARTHDLQRVPAKRWRRRLRSGATFGAGGGLVVACAGISILLACAMLVAIGCSVVFGMVARRTTAGTRPRHWRLIFGATLVVGAGLAIGAFLAYGNHVSWDDDFYTLAVQVCPE